MNALDLLDDDSLHAVLLQLPWAEALRAAQVCRRFRDVVRERSFLEKVAIKTDVPVPDPSPPDMYGYLRVSLGFTLDPAQMHPRLTMAPDRRSVEHTAESPESDYFAACKARQEVPMMGTHRYTIRFFARSDMKASTSYWGAISVVGPGYNIGSHGRASYDGMSEGFWDSNTGVGLYSDGSGFGLDNSFRGSPLDTTNEFSVEVCRERRTVRFYRGDQKIAEFRHSRIRTDRLWFSALVMRQGLGFRLVRVRHEPTTCAGPHETDTDDPGSDDMGCDADGRLSAGDDDADEEPASD